jgi:Tol biopolymer transport system component
METLAPASLVDLGDFGTTELPYAFRAAGAEHFEVSPDGSTIAFDAKDGDGLSQVHVADINGDHMRQLTNLRSGGHVGGWSPDGSRIVLSSGDLWHARILVVDVGSGDINSVTKTGAVLAPSFSPNGRTILYTRARSSESDLMTVPVRGGEPAVLIEFAVAGSFSPDGAQIAFHRTLAFYCGTCAAGEVTIVVADGSEQPGMLQPTNFHGSVATLDQLRSIVPRWSRSGDILAYRNGSSGASTTLHVVNVRSGRITDIGEGQDPSWLDDQTLIVADWEQFT